MQLILYGYLETQSSILKCVPVPLSSTVSENWRIYVWAGVVYSSILRFQWLTLRVLPSLYRPRIDESSLRCFPAAITERKDWPQKVHWSIEDKANNDVNYSHDGVCRRLPPFELWKKSAQRSGSFLVRSVSFLVSRMVFYRAMNLMTRLKSGLQIH